jgi:GGDEF domain-containing protein
VDDLLRNADLAMYAAKNRGKARFELFESSIHGAE